MLLTNKKLCLATFELQNTHSGLDGGGSRMFYVKISQNTLGLASFK